MNLERKVYETRSQKVGDFFLGVGLMIGMNVVLGFILQIGFSIVASMASATNNDALQGLISFFMIVAYSLPCLIQIVLLIYFGLTRYWIALGMLAAVAFGLLLVLLLAAGCFILIAGMSGGFGR